MRSQIFIIVITLAALCGILLGPAYATDNSAVAGNDRSHYWSSNGTHIFVNPSTTDADNCTAKMFWEWKGEKYNITYDYLCTIPQFQEVFPDKQSADMYI